MNRIRLLQEHGQSVWFDGLSRSMIFTGALHRLVEEDGVTGVSTSPVSFEREIGLNSAYDSALSAAIRADANALEIYENLAFEDVQWACDVLRPVHDRTQGQDGFVSFDVMPYLARDSIGLLKEGLRLVALLDRPNIMIKIPGTPEGIGSFERFVTNGVNTQITLLFGKDRFTDVFEAYVAGLEKRAARGDDISKISTVATLFVSRIDSAVDASLDDRLQRVAKDSEKRALEALRSRAGLAVAKSVHVAHELMLASDRWKRLERQGARALRLAFGSTTAKDATQRDVRYVEELIEPGTISVIAASTYAAFQAHGNVRRSSCDEGDAAEVLESLELVDISMRAVMDALLNQGLHTYAEAFDRSISRLERRRVELLDDKISKATYELGELEKTLEPRLESLRKAAFSRRLWGKDPSLFASDGDAGLVTTSMGWLDAIDDLLDRPDDLLDLHDDLMDDGVEHVVLLGIGGSSLATEVFRQIFGGRHDSPELHVLDSTVPAQVLALEKKIDLPSTVFIVASKSGTTVEPTVFDAYFWGKVRSGDQFIAITDPGTPLERSAMSRAFRTVFNGDPEIGGRYSALSPFGLVPLSAMGLDVFELLLHARRMVGSCQGAVPPAENAGIRLGITLGELALAGRDKLTIVSSAKLAAFGAWLEELVAGSSGKHGKGIIPVNEELLEAPGFYGQDRVFVYFRLRDDGSVESEALEHKLRDLANAGHPVLTFDLAAPEDLVQEIFRWEIAVTSLCHVLGVNPFDQPNVQESKTFTRSLIDGYKKEGRLPEATQERYVVTRDGISVFTDDHNAKLFEGVRTIPEVFERLLGTGRRGDYVAVNAYLEMNPENQELLQELRHQLRGDRRLATTLGFGPRFLHSTGQLHKGGPDSGIFVQITADDAVDAPIPGEGFSFSVLKTAQERGDFMALSNRRRRLIRVHLPAEVKTALQDLIDFIP